MVKRCACGKHESASAAQHVVKAIFPEHRDLSRAEPHIALKAGASRHPEPWHSEPEVPPPRNADAVFQV
jgi:hypothetical protein